MGSVKMVAAALALAAPWPAAAHDVTTWRPYTVEASQRFGVPITWIERVMRIESGGRTRLAGRPIVSTAGAVGLMQLMPSTWAAMRALAGLGSDPFDPHDNIVAGTLYLRMLYDRFGYPGLFAAYNAGPERYTLYLAGRRRLPVETVSYIAAASDIPPAAPSPGLSRSASLFALLSEGTSRASGAGSPLPTLFAIAPRP